MDTAELLGPAVSSPAPTADAEPTRTRIPSLDGLRAISILLVLVAHHITLFATSRGLPRTALWWPRGFGSLGVSVFFALSGFLITSLLIEERKQAGRVDLGAFYFRRAFRILPAFWAFLAITFVITREIPTRDIAAAALFASDYVPISSWWLGHTWSLSVEEQFYLLWPMAFVFLETRRVRQLALVLVVASPILRILTLLILPASYREQMGLMLHMRVDALMVGCLLALEWRSPASRWLAYLGHRGTALASLGFLLAGSPWLQHFLKGYYKYTVGLGLESAAIASLITWAIRNPKGSVGGLLNSRPLVRIGVLSYSLYLWQQPFFDATVASSPLMPSPVNIALAFGAAELSYRYVESPFLAARRKVQSLFAARRMPAS
jgi:peptidoglycan/LPS O-acetylase OafA/YrhL